MFYIFNIPPLVRTTLTTYEKTVSGHFNKQLSQIISQSKKTLQFSILVITHNVLVGQEIPKSYQMLYTIILQCPANHQPIGTQLNIESRSTSGKFSSKAMKFLTINLGSEIYFLKVWKESCC